MTKNKLDLQKEAGYLKITYLGEYYFLGMKVGELYVYNNQGTKLFDNAYQSASVNQDKFVLGQDSVYYLGMKDDGGQYITDGPYESIYLGESAVFLKKEGKWSLQEKLGAIPETFTNMLVIKKTSSGKTYYAVEEKSKRWTVYTDAGKRYNRYAKTKIDKWQKAGQNTWNAKAEGLSGFSIEKLK